MAQLENSRHERFAQELAKGSTADAAYVAAGFSENRGNATRLKANESVEARVSEILGRAATRTEITVASLSERLLKILAKCETSAESNKLNVARQTITDLAKLNGLIVDKREHAGRGGGPIEYANLTEAEIDARLAAAVSGDVGADAPEPEA